MKDFHRQTGVGTRKFHKTKMLVIRGSLSFGYLTSAYLSGCPLTDCFRSPILGEPKLQWSLSLVLWGLAQTIVFELVCCHNLVSKDHNPVDFILPSSAVQLVLVESLPHPWPTVSHWENNRTCISHKFCSQGTYRLTGGSKDLYSQQ